MEYSVSLVLAIKAGRVTLTANLGTTIIYWELMCVEFPDDELHLSKAARLTTVTPLSERIFLVGVNGSWRSAKVILRGITNLSWISDYRRIRFPP